MCCEGGGWQETSDRFVCVGRKVGLTHSCVSSAVLWCSIVQREGLWDGESLSGWSLDSKEADGPMTGEHQASRLQPDDHEGTDRQLPCVHRYREDLCITIDARVL